jgi:hypothetical protein
MTSDEVTTGNSLLSLSFFFWANDLNFGTAGIREMVRVFQMLSPSFVIMLSIFTIIDTFVLLQSFFIVFFEFLFHIFFHILDVDSGDVCEKFFVLGLGFSSSSSWGRSGGSRCLRFLILDFLSDFISEFTEADGGRNIGVFSFAFNFVLSESAFKEFLITLVVEDHVGIIVFFISKFVTIAEVILDFNGSMEGVFIFNIFIIRISF